MSAVIALEAIPNQSLSFVVDNTRVDLRLIDLGPSMAADVSINGVPILLGLRVVAGTPVIPYEHLESGNLMFVTDGAAPYWPEFNRTQWLVYLTEAEVNAA